MTTKCSTSIHGILLAIALLSNLAFAQQSFAPQPSAQQPGIATDEFSEAKIKSESFAVADTPAWIIPIEIPKDGKSAPLFIRLRDSQIRFDDKGNTEQYSHIVIAGTDNSTMQHFGQRSIRFDPRYQKLLLHRVSILRDDKRIDVRDKIKPRFLPDDKATNTVFSGKANALFQVPDFRPGDQLELAWTISGENPLFTDRTWAIEEWSMQVPIWKRHLAYVWPENLPKRVSIHPHVATSRSRVAAIQRQEHTANGWHHVRFSDEGLPSLVMENGVARGVTQNDVFMLTSFRDWSDVALWGSNLFDGVAKPASDDYVKLVEELQKLPSKEEQVAAALQWVRREIRYVSVSIGENSHRPYSPDEVLARRYGDCKDTALLLVQLLRSLDIESHPALVQTSRSRLPQQMDSAPWFDHVVAVAWLNEKVTVLDGTIRDQTAVRGRMPSWRGGDDVFIVSGKNTGFLRVPYPGSIDDRTFRQEERMVIDPSGESGTLTMRTTFRGIFAERKRREIGALERSTLRREMLADIRRVYANAEWLSGPTFSDNQETNEVVIRSIVKVPQPLKTSAGNLRYEYGNSVLTSRLPRIQNALREVPVDLSLDTQRVFLSHTLDVPPNLEIEDRTFEEKIESSAFSAILKRHQSGATRIVIREELNLLKDTVEADNIPEFRQAVQRLLDFRPEIRLRNSSDVTPQ